MELKRGNEAYNAHLNNVRIIMNNIKFILILPI